MRKDFGDFDKPTQWEPYVNNDPYCFCNLNGGYAYGVLKNINKREDFAEIQPSIVFNLDNSQASINNQKPTRLPLPLGIIRPLPEGMSLEKFVEDYNKRKEAETRAKAFQREDNILIPHRDFKYP